MNQALKLKIGLSQRLAMTQSLAQALQILQMPQMELGEWLREEIEKNPLLKLETKTSKYSNREIPAIAASNSLYDHLMKQIRELFPSKELREKAEKLMEDLDERGFIPETTENMEAIIVQLQTLDPPGIFARNLRESLLIQLKRKNKEKTGAYELIKNYFDDLLKKRFQKIKNKLGESEFREALDLISHLNFRPRALFKEEYAPLAKADLIIIKTEKGWKVQTLEDEWPVFQYDETYHNLKGGSSEEKEALRNWKNSAQTIFNAIKRRQELLIKIGSFLVRKQKDFLDEKGDLKPLTVQELATHLDVHESTLSRALAGKYAITPRGFMPLKALFCSSATAQTAKQLLQKLIEKEDKNSPLTDEELMRALQKAGLQITRRTVVKYRHEMKINIAAQRKHQTL